MDHTIYTYRDEPFNGRLYVKIVSQTQYQSVKLSLSKDGQIVATKDATQKFVMFKHQNVGLYQVIAELTLEDNTVVVEKSNELNIVSAPQPRPALALLTKGTPGAHFLVENAERHFLELNFVKGGLALLQAEPASALPKAHSLLSQAVYSKISLKAFWQEDDDDEDCERYRVALNAPDHALIAIAEELEQLPYVNYCSIVPDSTNMAPPRLPLRDDGSDFDVTGQEIDAASTTPNFQPLQGYLNDTIGMNVLPVWELGETGFAATVRIMDFGVYRNHEDLIDNITVVNSRPETEDCNHGTATTGCIAATSNAFGMTGIAHHCNLFFYDVGLADIDRVVQDAQPGDVVGICMVFVINGLHSPATGVRAWFDRIRVLTNRGVSVLMAAGNSRLDLQNSPSIMPDYGNSGGVLVGACVHTTGRRADFSNFNHRELYLNSWGDWSVATTGYGYLQRINNERNYTATYSGTSSALPLCTGAVALIQAFALRRSGIVLSGPALRSLIAETGHQKGLADLIGYRPNVRAALTRLGLRSSDIFVLDTQTNISHIGNDPYGIHLRNQLQFVEGIDIRTHNNAWTQTIVFPAASEVQNHRILIFSNQATLAVNILVNNQSIAFPTNTSGRWVSISNQWRRLT